MDFSVLTFFLSFNQVTKKQVRHYSSACNGDCVLLKGAEKMPRYSFADCEMSQGCLIEVPDHLLPILCAPGKEKYEAVQKPPGVQASILRRFWALSVFFRRTSFLGTQIMKTATHTQKWGLRSKETVLRHFRASL